VVTVELVVDVEVVAVPLPQTFGMPLPPQVSEPVQTPQSSVPPQLSPIVPQFLHAMAQLMGVQPQTFGVPLPPQVSGGVHAPHDPPQPSSPHSLPAQVGVQSVVVVGALVVVDVDASVLRLCTVRSMQLSTRASFGSSSLVVKQSPRCSARTHFCANLVSALTRQTGSTGALFWTALA
jgi:hypothetical protein